METSDPNDLPARLQRIEESQGFAERTIEELSAEIAGLNRRLAEAQSRLLRVESRLQQLLEPPGDAEAEGGLAP